MTSFSSKNIPISGAEIGHLSGISNGAREYIFGIGVHAFRMFVVTSEHGVRAYVNRCPHYSLPLNHRPDQFLTRNGDRIMCRQHLALFAIEDGACLDGACEGQGLEPIEVTLRDDGMIVMGGQG